MRVIWFATTGLQNNPRLRDVLRIWVVLASPLSDTLEIVVQDDVVGTRTNGDVEGRRVDCLHQVVEEHFCEIILAVRVLEVDRDEDVRFFEVGQDVLAGQHLHELVAGIEVVVVVGC